MWTWIVSGSPFQWNRGGFEATSVNNLGCKRRHQRHRHEWKSAGRVWRFILFIWLSIIFNVFFLQHKPRRSTGSNNELDSTQLSTLEYTAAGSCSSLNNNFEPPDSLTCIQQVPSTSVPVVGPNGWEYLRDRETMYSVLLGGTPGSNYDNSHVTLNRG